MLPMSCHFWMMLYRCTSVLLDLQFWTSSETLKSLSHGEYFKKTEGDKFEWPPVIKSLLDEGS